MLLHIHKFLSSRQQLQKLTSYNTSLSGTEVRLLSDSYMLCDLSAGGRFEVDKDSGVVQTKGSEPFLLDMEYVLYVRADRVSEAGRQSTAEERLSIVGGKRPPQFYQASYEVEVSEALEVGANVVQVEAKSFADHKIEYSLLTEGQGDGTFTIEPTLGVVSLADELDFEDLRKPQIYSLLVTGTELDNSGGFSTTVRLTVTVSDVDDTAPAPRNCRISKIDEETVKLEWMAPLGWGFVSNYQLGLMDTNIQDTYHFQPVRNQTWHILRTRCYSCSSNLGLMAAHQFKVVASSSANLDLDSLNSLPACEIVRPVLPPESITVNALTSRALAVTWDTAASLTSEVLAYQVYNTSLSKGKYPLKQTSSIFECNFSRSPMGQHLPGATSQLPG